MCLGCLYLVTLEVWKCGSVEVWKCGNMEMCLHCLFLLTLEVWKRGNVSWLSLSSNSGSVEVWKVEICLHCLYLITLEVCKSVNLEMCLSYPSPGRSGYFLITGKWGCAAGWGCIFNRVTRMGSHIFEFFGVRQFFILTVSKPTRMFVL